MDSLPALRLDSDDRIVSANDAWARLCQDVRGIAVGDDARGRPFSDFALDEGLVSVFQFAFRKVRQTGEGMKVPFRIEAATHRWHLDLQIEPLEGGALECRYTTFFVEVVGQELLTLCAWCKRVRLPEGTWVRRQALAEDIDRILGESPKVSHGICPTCRHSFRESLGLTRG